ncbi:MAG: hypothetical protein JW874_09315 [Spirochaetales bacterium]|nr:hypothetical protein [Spirochaetales bacterium]
MKIALRIVETALAVSFVFLVSFAFSHMDTLEFLLGKGLRLKTEPSFIGGEVMARFLDTNGDDNGAGTLTYPRNENWPKNGALDLLAYTVHYPVTNNEHPTWNDYWQLDFTFASLDNPLNGRAGFSFPVIHVYFDIDGKAGGSLETRQARAELASFSVEYPWDYMLHVDGFSSSGSLVSCDGTYQAAVEIIPDHEDNKILVRLPLEKGGIINVLKMEETRHYVIIGAYDMTARGNFMILEERPGTTRGGGAREKNTPRIYDYLVPAGMAQQNLLSPPDDAAGAYAVLEPVKVRPGAGSGGLFSEEELARLKQEADAEQQAGQENNVTEQQMQGSAELIAVNPDAHDCIIALIRSGYYDEARAEAERILEQDPQDGFVLAYYGALTAMKGSSAGDLGEKVKAVHEAFAIFARADGHIPAGNPDRLDLLLNRANVAISVPESVFFKSLQGAADFLEAAQIYLDMDEDHSRQAADAYYHAGICYENAGKAERAELAFVQALSTPGVSARVRYELALKGVGLQ